MSTHNTGCKQCGTCCCNIPITATEKKNIQKYLSNHPDLVKRMFRKFNPEACIFLIHEKDDIWKCAIYDSGARPVICQVFGTKGLPKLHCPEGNVINTPYTKKQALHLINHSGKPIGMMNEIMLPFIRQTLKKDLMEKILKTPESF